MKNLIETTCVQHFSASQQLTGDLNYLSFFHSLSLFTWTIPFMALVRTMHRIPLWNLSMFRLLLARCAISSVSAFFNCITLTHAI